MTANSCPCLTRAPISAYQALRYPLVRAYRGVLMYAVTLPGSTISWAAEPLGAGMDYRDRRQRRFVSCLNQTRLRGGAGMNAGVDDQAENQNSSRQAQPYPSRKGPGAYPLDGRPRWGDRFQPA